MDAAHARLGDPAVTLREVTRENWRTTLRLAVRPDQQRFVADHAPIALVTLAKAYVRPGGLNWTPYAIYAGERAVGMLALACAPSRADECWIYHFFIDQAEQGRGYGRAALAALVALARAERPACRHIRLTVHPENRGAQRLYAGAGFRPTGAKQDGEPVYELSL